ncbi:N-acetyl-alpha-D-glucosaminyl L-malate synthase BshA [Paenibacillus sp. 481]|uniref:N-acetyl-alpha-D-glucosaminyl L-malate synthase BshA n=1 Tax=Paenibacillus sp. 481 TaxID=2835869 RepID=UPI001E30A2F6|nr:N-acetyl-alpha-D-glucosaminyl L-malate synthase BshA [Paenibacillus sp. 481]UHA72991.1 N-acetyl-alpha-D-glucosaminyl L-malate synthase BshA [Paenibacillus sp. 481]
MNDSLKIGITCYPSLGGSGVVATELGKLLAERGHQVHFITHNIPFRLGSTFQKNIHYHEVDVNDYYVFRYPPYDLSLASKMAQVANMQQLDLLHVHYAVPHAICAYLAKQMAPHLKVVTTLHGTDITVLAQDESLKDMIRFAINQSDAVTAVSSDLIRETRELLDITREVDLTYNFVDKRVYYPRDCSQLRSDFAFPHEKILMHISNFRPVKRVTDVIETFARVHESVPSRLMLVGEGPDMPKVQCKIREMGLEDRVHFLGKQDEIAQVISLADVLLLPSEKESFGLVALEAMACGVPTIGSEAGGIPELISHRETGYLAPIGDTDLMAQYAIELLSNDELAAKMREACLHRARNVFCNDLITQKYEEIYYRVLGKTVTPFERATCEL